MPEFVWAACLGIIIAFALLSIGPFCQDEGSKIYGLIYLDLKGLGGCWFVGWSVEEVVIEDHAGRRAEGSAHSCLAAVNVLTPFALVSSLCSA